MSFKIIICGFLTIMTLACNKSEDKATTESAQVEKDQEANLEQEARIFVNEKGEEISIIYFANGEQVGVKLIINNETRELQANGTNKNGDPVFTDGQYAWEMLGNSISGRLTDRDLNVVDYKIKE